MELHKISLIKQRKQLLLWGNKTPQMKRITLLFTILYVFTCQISKAQDSCLTAVPFCTGTAYNFYLNTGITAPVGPNYGCLGSQASPLWFSVNVTSPGDVFITGYGLDTFDNAVDIDFIYWGPFASLSGVCYSQLDAAHIMGCDYSTSNLINVSIPSATAGSFYIAMISNYAAVPAFISYEQTSGSGAASCVVPFSFSSLTASPSVCNITDNTYNVSGAMNFISPPTTGTLTVFGSCGGSQTFTPPFSSPLNYSFNGLASNGATCFVTAIFSAESSSSLTQMYSAPAICNPFLGVNENVSGVHLTVAPNPTDGMVDVFMEALATDAVVQLTDISGRLVFKEFYQTGNGNYHKQLDLSTFSKGVYFVKIASESGSTTQKIIYY